MLASRRCLHSSTQGSLGEVFKSAMARISSPAMILTAGCIPKAKEHDLHGMTLSSVCSISVYPKPLLSFNLHLPSYTSKALHENQGLLGIHLMPSTAFAATLGRTFAGGIKRDPSHFYAETEQGDLFNERTTPFAGLSNSYYMHNTKDGISIPVLKESEVALLCQKHRVFDVDNHELWIVEVQDVVFPNERFSSDPSGGLLYFQRGFHRVGNSLSE